MVIGKYKIKAGVGVETAGGIREGGVYGLLLVLLCSTEWCVALVLRCLATQNSVQWYLMTKCGMEWCLPFSCV